MGYHFLYLLLLIILTSVSGEEPSMIRIFGKPGTSNSSEKLNVAWQDCMGICWADFNCSYFNFGTISTIQQAATKDDEIALKIQIPQDQCPASNPLIPGPTFYTQIINGQLYKTIVSQDSHSKNIYNLTYSIATCPKSTKLFQRGETTVVCIGIFFFEAPRCNIQTEASALCKAHKGTLTGPANDDEYEYIQDISNSSKYTSNPDSIIWLAYWIDGVSTTDGVTTTGIDGVSTNTEYYIFEDPTHDGTTNYQWTNYNGIISPRHYKHPGFCLYNPGPHDCNVQDDPCSYTLEAQGDVCWRGALCQVPPIIENY